MGSGVSKKGKKNKAEFKLTTPGSSDTKAKKTKKKNKKDKDFTDIAAAGNNDVRAKTKKDKKPKKKDKKEKDDKTNKKKGKKNPPPEEILEITSPIPTVQNVYQVEQQPKPEITEDSSKAYSLERNATLTVPDNRESVMSEDSYYSTLVEDDTEGKDSKSNPDHVYENDPSQQNEETEYVDPDDVEKPSLPPKKRENKKPSVKRPPAKDPPKPAERSSGEYEVANHKSYIGKTPNPENDHTGDPEDYDGSDPDYDDTVTGPPPVEERKRQKPPLKAKPVFTDDSPGIKVVVAIDFGTTFTGYAYSYIDERENIIMNPNWAGARAASFKTPTWVALDKSNGLQAFGFEAQNTYHLDQEEYDDKIKLYKEFKLQLMKKDSSDEQLLLQSEYGEGVSAMTIFSEVIKFLKERILKGFDDAGKSFRPWQICWVLTVPAIWDDAQKLFMKEAAKKAGLIRNVDDKHLVIALEPEAASLYCRTLKMNNFKGGSGESTVKLPKGTVYMVLDAGGGTIDITVHKVLEENKIAEIYQANGGPWGGSKINGRFETKMKGLLGDDFVSHCQKENPGVWLDLILEFEQAKQSDAARPNSNKPLILTLSLGLNECFSEFKGQSLKNEIHKYKDSGFQVNRHGKLEVSSENVREMFSTVVGKTVDHMYSILRKPEIAKTTAIFIVGGFGQCPYLQDEVKKHFEEGKRRVLIPTEGNLCVVKGAVMFGHQPDFMSTRIARYTYAYQDKRPFNATTDGDRKTIKLANGEHGVRCLTTIIKKGEEVGYTEERRVEFEVDTEEFTLPIYCSESEDVDNPEAENVTEMGELHIELPKNKRSSRIGQAEKVMVTFTLSTELKVKGTHMASKTTTETRLQMKSKQRKK